MTTEMSRPAPQWLYRLAIVALFFALIRNLLPPNAFTATVLLFDYDFGLIRRGIIGELANLFWGETVSRNEIYLASVMMTFFGVIPAALLFFRRLPANIAGYLLLILLFSSFAFAALIASTGYIDLILIGMVCLTLFSSAASLAGVFLRVLVAILGVFMHEVMLPYFAVFFAFDIWIARPAQKMPTRFAIAVLPLLGAVAALVVLSKWGQLPAGNYPAFVEYIAAKAEFTPDPHATIVMERTLGDNLNLMAEKRGMTDYRSWVLFDGIPLFAMTLWMIWLNLKLLGREAPFLTRFALIAAIIAPMSLNIIAFDVVRFGAISVFVGFLCVISQMHTIPASRDRLAQIISWPLFVIVLLLNLNIAVNQLNSGDGHEYLFPWVLVKQLGWLPGA